MNAHECTQFGRAILLVIADCASRSHAAQTTKISVDATDSRPPPVSRQDDYAGEAGAAFAALSEWIPGEHGPTGPITDLVNIRITANGAADSLASRPGGHVRLSWSRFPQGVNSIDIALDFIAAPESFRLFLRRIDYRQARGAELESDAALSQGHAAGSTQLPGRPQSSGRAGVTARPCRSRTRAGRRFSSNPVPSLR